MSAVEPIAIPVIAQPVERLAYTAKETATCLGVSLVTLWRLQKRGLLLPVPGLGKRLYSVESIKRFAAGEAPKS